MIHKQRLNNRILSLVLALVMVLSMLPVASFTTFAASATATPVIKEADGYVAAFGTPIYIEAGTTEGYTVVWYYKGSTKTYLTANGDSGQALSGYTVYGGAPPWNAGYYQNTEWDFKWNTVAATSITMTGGTLAGIVANSYLNYESSASLLITGGTVGSIDFNNAMDSSSGKSNGNSTGLVLIDGFAGSYSLDHFTGIYRDGDICIVQGSYALTTDITVGEGDTLSIPGGAVLTNSSTITNNGTITIDGMLNNNGTITNNGTIYLNVPQESGVSGVNGITGNPIVRNAMSIVTSEPGVPTVYVGETEVSISTTEYVDGKLYLYPKYVGNVKATLNDTDYYGIVKSLTGESALSSIDIDFSLTAIKLGPTVDLADYTTIYPGLPASETTISYEVLPDSTANYSLSGSKLIADRAGTILLKITVKDAFSEEHSETFTINTESTKINIASGAVNIIRKRSANTLTVEWAGFDGGSKEYELNELIVITGTTTAHSITVSGNTTANVVLDGVNIKTLNPVSIGSGATMNLHLVGNNELTGADVSDKRNAGLHVPSGATVSIDGSGSLTARGSYYEVDADNIYGGPGIGSNYEEDMGTVIINGGTVKAIGNEGKGEMGAPGIGASWAGDGGTVTITGGTVTATGGLYAAGIGTSFNKAGGTVTITGGTVTANGGPSGAGIGGGWYGNGGTVTITGGMVTANGGNQGAGIGGGYGGAGGTVTISGGTVTANGGNQGTGIGGGYRGDGGTVVITGGNIKAIAGSNAEAIGKGHRGSSSGTLTNGTEGDQPLKFATITLAGVSGQATVTDIDAPAYYGLNDVVTMDGGKLYLYLPADQIPEAINLADGSKYTDHDNDLTFVKECETHTYTTAGVFIWADDASSAMFAVKCDVCAYNNVLGNAAVTSSLDRAENCQERDMTTYTASYEFGGMIYSDVKDVYGSVGAHPMNDKGYCDICDMAFDSDRDGYYEIWTPGHLNWFSGLVNGTLNDETAQNQSANAILMANLDMSGVSGYVPIGGTTGLYYSGDGDDKGYQGIFDGNGHVISNLSVTGSSSDELTYGVFGTLSGTVKHLGVENFAFTLGSQDCRAGGIAGQMLSGSFVTDCYVANSTITATDKVAGGIAGCNYAGIIGKCHTYKVSVTASRAGGIVGDNRGDVNDSDRKGTIINCYTDASTIENSQRTGILIDCIASVSTETFASGEITYKLNDGRTVWKQTLTGADTKAYPQFSGGIVDYDAETNSYNNRHVHEWEYAVEGTTITAACKSTIGSCTNTDGGSVTIAKPTGLTYTGGPIEAVVINTLTTGGAVAVEYTGHTTNGYPVNAGSYTASIIVADGPSVSVDFTVEAASIADAAVTVDVTAPEAGAEKQTAVQGGIKYSAAISWNCDTEKFGYNTAYTATVTLTADRNHKFENGLTVSGWNVVISADGTTADLTKTFDATAKAKLTAISAPVNKTLGKYYTNVADAIKELPATVTYTTESGNVTVGIEWACSNYDSAAAKVNTFTWRVKDDELANYNVNGISITGTITVTNADVSTPATADTINPWLWAVLMFVSGGAVITLTVYDRKRRNTAIH